MGGTHSRNSSGAPHGQNGSSGDSSANLFSSEHGLWAYIQTLEDRLRVQDERIRGLEEQLRQQTEKTAALESSKQNHDAQISRLISDSSAPRGHSAPPRAQADLSEPSTSKA